MDIEDDAISLSTRLQFAAGSDRLKNDWRTRKLLEEAARSLSTVKVRKVIETPENINDSSVCENTHCGDASRCWNCSGCQVHKLSKKLSNATPTSETAS